MKIAASMSVGRLAPKHSLNIDGIRTISKNVTPSLIKNDVVLIDRLRSQDGKHLTIEEEFEEIYFDDGGNFPTLANASGIYRSFVQTGR